MTKNNCEIFLMHYVSSIDFMIMFYLFEIIVNIFLYVYLFTIYKVCF